VKRLCEREYPQLERIIAHFALKKQNLKQHKKDIKNGN